MPDLFGKWWKQILLITTLAVIVALVVTVVTPKKYVATATAAPASSFAADRSRLFNQNIEALYSVLGTADDLDLVLGTSKLDTVYLAVVDDLNLTDQFDVSETGEARRMKIATIIKKNTSVQKSGYGELRIRVWDKERERAAAIANAILDKLRSIHQSLQAASNISTLESLIAEKQRRDSLGRDTSYDELIRQYQFLVNNKPPVLLTIESARVPQWPDKPKTWRNLVAAGALGFLFSVLLVLYLEKRRDYRENN